MTDEKDTSLLSVDVKVDENVKTYMGKIADATGGAIEAWMIKKEAQNRAETRIIEAEENTKLEELSRRAQHRKEREEAMHQLNMESIAQKSLPLLAKNAKSEDMENDWITNFFAKARYTSDEDMQQIWAGILAGEAGNPGSYSKRAVNILADLDKKDVELFQTACRFGWYIAAEFNLVIFDEHQAIYNNVGINFDALCHLRNLGFFQFNGMISYYKHIHDPGVTLLPMHYFGQSLYLNHKDNSLLYGKAMLTQAGNELARLTNPFPVEGFYEHAKREWKKLGYIPHDETQ